jgi:hypothetical protein
MTCVDCCGVMPTPTSDPFRCPGYKQPALKANTGGSIPSNGNGKLEHPNPKQRAAEPTRDEIEFGLMLGNLFAAAAYGPRGEHRN